MRAQHTPLWNVNFLYCKSSSGLALRKVFCAKLPFHQTKWKWIRHSDTLVWPHTQLCGVNPDVAKIKAKPTVACTELLFQENG